jgi:hypothetical protein
LLNRPQRFAKPGDAKQKRPAPKHKRKRRR